MVVSGFAPDVTFPPLLAWLFDSTGYSSAALCKTERRNLSPPRSARACEACFALRAAAQRSEDASSLARECQPRPVRREGARCPHLSSHLTIAERPSLLVTCSFLCPGCLPAPEVRSKPIADFDYGHSTRRPCT